MCSHSPIQLNRHINTFMNNNLLTYHSHTNMLTLTMISNIHSQRYTSHLHLTHTIYSHIKKLTQMNDTHSLINTNMLAPMSMLTNSQYTLTNPLTSTVRYFYTSTI